jgi:hypothetical protein
MLPLQAENFNFECFPWMSACFPDIFLIHTPIKAKEHDVCQ